MKFSKLIKSNWEEDNMLPPELDPQLALDILKDYLLGKDYYVNNAMNCKQCNSCIVNAILEKYSKEYRKEINICDIMENQK